MLAINIGHGAKVYHRGVGVQHKCYPAAGVSRSR